jgi:hypothetical protein
MRHAPTHRRSPRLLSAPAALAFALAATLAWPSRAAADDSGSAAGSSDAPPPEVPHETGEGTPGIKLGPFRLHASLFVAGGYDSNVFFSNGAGDPVPIIGSPVLHIGPRLEGATGRPVNLDGRFYAALTWHQYFTRMTREQSDAAAELGLQLIVFPLKPISFLIEESFVRYVEASFSVLAGDGNPFTPNPGPRLDRDLNRLGLGVRVKPGHGAFQVDLMNILTFDWFESRALDLGSSIRDEVLLRSKWKFFPKTALTHEFSLGYQHYFCNVNCNAGYYNIDSFPLRTYLGIIGLLTPRLEFMVKVGYGNSFHRTTDPANTGISYEGPLAAASLGYRAGEHTRVGLLYEHGFSDAIFSNFYIFDMGKLFVDQSIGARVIIHVEGAVAYLNYDFPPVVPNVTLPMEDRREVRLGLNAKIDFYIMAWLTVGAAWSLTGNFTTYVVTNATTGDNNPSYIKNVVLLTAIARY